MSGSRVVFITGTARGLGRAMALHLATPETHLLLHHRGGGDEPAELCGACRERGARVTPLGADLASAEAREALLAQVHGLTATLHVLVNNVGVFAETPLLELTPGEWQTTFDATCTAVFHLTQGLLPLLRRGAPARVINLGDSGADRIVARPQATAYHVAKLGVHVLTRSYAKTLGPDGITVNMISPGFLDNSLGAPLAPIPAGRAGRFADVLGALDYLLSPAADYVSGANLLVSGGWNT